MDRITQIQEAVIAKLPALIDEARDAITEAATLATEAAQDDPDGKKESVVPISISAKWNLDRNHVDVSVSVNVKRKFSECVSLPDPNQPGLPGVEETRE